MHQPTDSFHCDYFDCTLYARACVLRQGKRIKLRNTGEERVALELQQCASGQCAQGNAIRRQLGDQFVEPARKAAPGLSGRMAAPRAWKTVARPQPVGLPPAEIEALDQDLRARALEQEQEKVTAEIAAAVEATRPPATVAEQIRAIPIASDRELAARKKAAVRPPPKASPASKSKAQRQAQRSQRDRARARGRAAAHPGVLSRKEARMT